jgi:hypothetical protein
LLLKWWKKVRFITVNELNIIKSSHCVDVVTREGFDSHTIDNGNCALSSFGSHCIIAVKQRFESGYQVFCKVYSRTGDDADSRTFGKTRKAGPCDIPQKKGRQAQASGLLDPDVLMVLECLEYRSLIGKFVQLQLVASFEGL